MDDFKRLAANALASGDLSRARELYERALALASDDDARGTLASNLSHVCLRARAVDDAKAFATIAASAKPSWSKSHMRLADCAFASGAYDDAERAYARARELEREDAAKASYARLERLANAASHGGVYFRQLIPGEDICVDAHAVKGDFVQTQIFAAARSMKNFIYVVGDLRTREAFVVDGCWDVKGIAARIAEDKMTLAGAIATHYHFDHTGGLAPIEPFRSMGVRVPGVKELVDDFGLKCHVHAADAAVIERDNKVSRDALVVHDGESSEIVIGEVKLEFIHTPGHSPGSCLVVCRDEYAKDGRGWCISGDTIFPGSCGRLDLKDSSRDAMFHSLSKCARVLPDEMVIYPGHSYNGASTTVAREKAQGLLRPFTKPEWDAMHGVA